MDNQEALDFPVMSVFVAIMVQKEDQEFPEQVVFLVEMRITAPVLEETQSLTNLSVSLLISKNINHAKYYLTLFTVEIVFKKI